MEGMDAQFLMHDTIVYKGQEYRFGYYSKVLDKAVIYQKCERHGPHCIPVELVDIKRKYD